jgi:hypothetical protein
MVLKGQYQGHLTGQRIEPEMKPHQMGMMVRKMVLRLERHQVRKSISRKGRYPTRNLARWKVIRTGQG